MVKWLIGEMVKEVKRFEDLEVWQNAVNLSVAIYFHLKNYKDYGLKDQLQRSSVSIPSNIAEGFERQTNKEFVQFLYIAKGSCGELRTQLYIAKQLNYISETNTLELLEKVTRISIMIYKLIQYRKSLTN